jgi:hypothetical protein
MALCSRKILVAESTLSIPRMRVRIEVRNHVGYGVRVYGVHAGDTRHDGPRGIFTVGRKNDSSLLFFF